MEALKNVYARLIVRSGSDTAKLNDLKIKIGTSFAVGLLIEAEQKELLEMMPTTATPTESA